MFSMKSIEYVYIKFTQMHIVICIMVVYDIDEPPPYHEDEEDDTTDEDEDDEGHDDDDDDEGDNHNNADNRDGGELGMDFDDGVCLYSYPCLRIETGSDHKILIALLF